MSDLETLSLSTAAFIGRSLAAGDASPVELTEFLLSKIESGHAPNVFIRVTRARAMAAARASEKRLLQQRPLSALDGVPIALKDLIDLDGETTTAGSAIYRDAVPAQSSAPIAQNLEAAGMVVLGKVNLTEFAYSGIGLNPHYGTPHNPHSADIPRVPGGSSSGSAVAVASGLSPCAIGTDTGGSVRIPASFNGLVGYKTSAGRIDSKGVFALSQTLDTVGPLARSVEDCILLDTALRGLIVPLAQRRSLDGMSLFVPETVVLDDLDSAVAENFAAGLAKLEAHGVIIKRAAMPEFSEALQLMASCGTILLTEAYVEHQALLDGPDAERIDHRVLARLRAGEHMTAANLVKVQRARIKLIAALKSRVGDALIAMPTTAMTAPEIAPLEADDDVFQKTNLKALRNTALGNFFDLPGLALPNGIDANHMPTSFLLSATGADDDRLLSAGLTVESALG